MRKRKGPAFYISIVVAFILGIFANLLARQYLPNMLPSVPAGVGFLATVLQMIVSAGVILLVVKIFNLED